CAALGGIDTEEDGFRRYQAARPSTGRGGLGRDSDSSQGRSPPSRVATMFSLRYPNQSSRNQPPSGMRQNSLSIHLMSPSGRMRSRRDGGSTGVAGSSVAAWTA